MNLLLIAGIGALLLARCPNLLRRITPAWLQRLIAPELGDLLNVFHKLDAKLHKFVEREVAAADQLEATAAELKATASTKRASVHSANNVRQNLLGLRG